MAVNSTVFYPPLGDVSLGAGDDLETVVTDTTANATTNVAVLRHRTTATPLANIGTGLVFASEDGGGADQNIAIIRAVLTDVTAGAEIGALRFCVQNTTMAAEASEQMRLGPTALTLGTGVALVTQGLIADSQQIKAGSAGTAGTPNFTRDGANTEGVYISAGVGLCYNGAATLFADATSVTLSSRLAHKVTAGITAGTTQTQGQGALTSDINEVSVCANANDVVTLPSAVAGYRVTVANNGAQVLQVFPASGDQFLGGAVDASTTVNAAAIKSWVAVTATLWIQD
jgi:hypothetical protein